VAAFVYHSGKQHRYNDRHINHKVEQRVRRMRPEDFAELLDTDVDDDEPGEGS